MRKCLIVVLMWLGMLAGCNGEPTYKGVTFMVFNYTPWDLDYVRMSDSDGGKATIAAIGVGGGGGSGSCCPTLKGTDFKVEWSGLDGEQAIKNRTKMDELVFRKVTPVHFPSTNVPPGEGPLYLQLHIYPDEHMEVALSRKLLGQERMPIVATTDWLYEQHRDALGQYRDVTELGRVLGKVAKTAWIKYRIEDKRDMQQYMYMYFVVASNFDADPEIAAILAKPNRKPGDFADALSALPKAKISQLKATGTAPGDKNV